MSLFTSLRARIIALVLGFCVLVVSIFVLVLNHAYMGYYDELRQRQGLIFARNVVQMYPQLGRFDSLDRADVEMTFEHMLLLDPSSAIYLLDATGKVRAGYTKERSIGGKPSVSLAPITRLLDAPIGETVFGEDPDFAARPTLFAAAPFVSDVDAKTPVGYVYVLMRPPDGDISKIVMSSYANRSAYAVAGGSAVACTLLIFAVLGLITGPLQRLTDSADAVSASASASGAAVAPYALPPDPYERRLDEVGRLARAFRTMVTGLSEQTQRVKRLDTTRREWVANVSHDLRTPLTSLIGHLEMVQLRGEAMTEPERMRFIDVALRNAQHLERLSSSLFDLARLDSDDLPLDRSAAHLGELLDDLVTRFVPAAEARGVRLTVDYAPGLPLVVVDAALVERAAVNLIDNALRYTPEQGTITLSATAATNAVWLRVADTGSGIEAEAIEHVFERFYQASKHREGRGHAGLGLALVHRVAELHGGSVSAANRGGGGAEFTMRFPVTALY
jgi:two-component system, OmpR family, sensor kinase